MKEQMLDSLETNIFGSLKTTFAGYDGPAFSIRLWNGAQWFSSVNRGPSCTILVANPRSLVTLISEPNETALGEAFVQGDLDVQGDIFAMFSVSEHLLRRPRTLQQKISERLARTAHGAGQRWKHGAPNSRARDSASIAYHYDQPLAFFEPWLGSSLVYSCAYFHDPQDALDAAQRQKLEHICRKLRLNPGERFLDIGCGWGSLLLHAAGEYQAEAEGVTLSHAQAEATQHRIKNAQLDGFCRVSLRDYRDLASHGKQFDKIASVGMYEHVGLHNLPLYFGIASRLLRPGGLFLNHGIARSTLSPCRESSFVDRYVFPTGHLVTLSQTLSAAEAAGFEVRDVENLREHYELTLRRWAEGLMRNAGEVLQYVSKTTYRIWLLYMAGSAAAFQRGDIGIYQVLLSRPDHGNSGLPLTRRHLYANAPLKESESLVAPMEEL